jgi:exosortase D (VPLPA-CTERM-specific)
MTINKAYKLTIVSCILIIPFLFFYWGTINGLINFWSTDGDYSYAFLMPLITGYIIWEKRKQIVSTPLGTNWLGSVFFFVFLCISLYGILGSSPSAVRPAIPLMILSITFFCFGTAMFRVLAFPLSVLIFMIPLPTVVQAKIGVPLKLIATKLGVFMMQLFGISVFIEGNVIDLGVTQLQVADACNGLRYILPLFAMGVLFAYFFEKIRWKQLVLVLATIPIAIIANAFRVGMTGILVSYYGISAAEGLFHDFSGWLVFMLSFGLLFLIHFGLKALPGKALMKGTKQSLHSSNIQSQPQPFSILPIIICSALLLLAGGMVFTTSALPALQLKNGFENFPLVIGGWEGTIEPLDNEIVSLSGAEEAFNAVYKNKDGQIVSLYIGYRGSPFNEGENFFHSPSVCLPSSGWETSQGSKRNIKNVAPFERFPIQEMIVEKMNQKQVVYYWFQTKNRISSNVNMNRFHLSLHAFMRDNTYDLFIRPITPLYPDEGIQSAEYRLDSFINSMMPVLVKYINKTRRNEK